MERISGNDEITRSVDLRAANVLKLQALFPGLVTEGKDGPVLNTDVLKQLIGDNTATDAEETFGLRWQGKRRALQQALTPTAGTLRPAIDESVNWDSTGNAVIEGDNLEVLKLLQKSYSGRVKAIYIDPPYNTGTDLLYPNDFQDGIRTYLEVTGQADGTARLVSNPETSGRYHTAWLNMMYPRLHLARNLLKRDDGVLICTIDENEQVNLGAVLKEVFDEGNYEHVCVTIVHNPRGIQGTNFSYTHEYAFFVYPRGTKSIGDRKIEPSAVTWSQFRNWGTESERHDARNCFYPVIVRDGRILGFGDVCADDVHPKQTEWSDETALVYPIDRSGIERKWRYARQSVEQVAHLLRAKASISGFEIEIGKDFGQYKTVWNDSRYDANEYGTGIVNALVPESPFSFPKSLWSVYDCLHAVVGDDKEALVLDFFAGSGTTGHAVYKMNAGDGGSRRFILVQLPEKIRNSRYTTIADVTRTRLRSAGTLIQTEAPMLSQDLGFRAFRLDASNIRAWDGAREAFSGSLLDGAEHLVAGRSEADILFELLIKLGLKLTVAIQESTIADKTVYSVGAGTLLVCLAEVVSRDDAEPLANGIADLRDSLAPVADSQIIFRDSGFADDVTKTNLAKILEQRGFRPALIRSL